MTILLVANTAAVPDGAEFTVQPDTSYLVAVYAGPGAVMAHTDCIWLDIKTENDAGAFTPIMQLGGGRPLFATLPVVGSEVTYRFRKPATTVAIGAVGQ